MVGVADNSDSGRAARWVLILFVLAAVLRIGWVAARYAGPNRSESLTYPDEEAYWLSARSLAAGEGLRDEFGFRATYMPAYPAFLAVFARAEYPIGWARVVQAILAAWVAPATFLAARRWARSGVYENGCCGVALPILAGLAAAVDPFLIFFSGLMLTEALFAAVIVTAWLFVMPLVDQVSPHRLRQAVIAGVLLLLAVMLRPSAAVLVMVTVAWTCASRGLCVQRIRSAALILLVVVAGLMPWAARNRAVIGEWRWLTTRSGISLYDGMQPGATGGSDLAHTKAIPQVRGLSEAQWDRFFREQAWSEVRQHPARVAALAWQKFLRTWSLTPNVEGYRQGPAARLSAGWMIVLLATAAVGLWFRRKRPAAVLDLLLPVIVFTLIHMVFVGSVRYRIPTMPFVMILSAAGISGCLMSSRRPEGSASPPRSGAIH